MNNNHTNFKIKWQYCLHATQAVMIQSSENFSKYQLCVGDFVLLFCSCFNRSWDNRDYWINLNTVLVKFIQLWMDYLNRAFSTKPHSEVLLRIFFFHRRTWNIDNVMPDKSALFGTDFTSFVAHCYVVRHSITHFFIAPFFFGGKCKLFQRTNSIWIKTWFIIA